MLLFSVLAAVVVLGASADTSTTSDLLWPKPVSATFGSSVYELQPNSFAFTATGPDSESDILRDAFKRYSDLIFQTPAPFYPSGAGANPSGPLPGLVVDVQSTDETLQLSTNESCKRDE